MLATFCFVLETFGESSSDSGGEESLERLGV